MRVPFRFRTLSSTSRQFDVVWLCQLALALNHLQEVGQNQVLHNVHPVRRDVPNNVEYRQQGKSAGVIDARFFAWVVCILVGAVAVL